MKNVRPTVVVCALMLSLCLPVLAGGDKGKGNSAKSPGGSGQPHAPSKSVVKSENAKPGQTGQTKLEAKMDISANEREVLKAYVKSYNAAAGHGQSPKVLPPGLAKKVARGGDLPPGWQKKCVRGEILPLEVFKHCHPLPREVSVKLPPAPQGTVMVAIEGKVVRLAKADHEILDVFDLH
jgi:hypothetical protein